MRSMTASIYGSKKMFGCRIGCNIASFNSRFVDINLTIPEVFQPYRMAIYDKVREKIKRGRIEMQIYLEDGNYPDSSLDFENVELQIKRLRELKKKFNLKGDIDLSVLTCIPEITQKKSNFDVGWEELNSFIDGLLENLIQVKEREGNFIKKDLEDKTKQFNEILEFVESKARKGSEEHKEKMFEDIQKLNDLNIQISREDINLFAFKGDIDEELVRLKSHVDYFLELLTTDGAVGRKLRFLLQEMAREVNTIGSKAYSAEIVHKVIDLKELLDEMREQVENIE